jgi:hypothetical protein
MKRQKFDESDMDDVILHRGEFTCTVADVNIRVEVIIKRSWATFMHFTLLGKLYTFEVTRWRARGLSTFCNLLIQRYPDGRFGTLDEFGQLPADFGDERRRAAVFQGCRDIMTLVNGVFTKYKRNVMDYAVWYRENHKETDTYEQYISLVACHCICHADMWGADMNWEIVRLL